MTDEFELYDLRIEVIATDRPMVCNHPEGAYFTVEGETLVFNGPFPMYPLAAILPLLNGPFPMYPLAAILPLLPAKQRPTAEADWMTTDAEIACPDPHCGGRFRITRTGKRTFRHAETTGLPERRGAPYWAKPND
jgi:uncharacterized repeat protein (TIGR04076 family)